MNENYTDSQDYNVTPPPTPQNQAPYGYQQQPQYTQPAPQQTIVVQQVEKKSNGLGTTGFIFAILAIVLCWVPILDFILWALGAIFSFVGLFKQPRGLAITGFILSFIGIILLIVFVGALAALSL